MSAKDLRCPTPHKTRYATEKMAQQRAEIRTHLGVSKIYRTYACPCGWFHLTTSHRGPYMTAKVQTVEELRALTHVQFRFIVSCDVKNLLEPKTKELLRTPEINSLWVSELKLLWMETLKEYNDARNAQHKKDILMFQKYVGVRRAEANNLRQRFVEEGWCMPAPETTFYPHPVDPNSTSTLRRQAFHNALRELCTTNFEQLQEIYYRELRPTWPEDRPFPVVVPMKYLKYLRGPGASELTGDDPEE